MDSTSVVLMQGDATLHLKETHHHYVGFYSKALLATILSDNLVFINGKEYLVSDDTVVNYYWDAQDLLVGQQRYVISGKPLEAGTKVYNSAGKLISLITTVCQGVKYPIANGFTDVALHVTDVTEPIFRSFDSDYPIRYAGEQFLNKTQLVEYIRASHDPSPRRCVLYSDDYRTQLIVYENGKNIFNIHFRKPAGRRVGEV